MPRSLLAALALFLGAHAMASSHALGQTAPLAADHAQRMALGRELFKREVRTLFIGRCLKCHGGDTTEGEFSLATREELLRGGSSGPAVDVNESSKSLLLRLIAHEEEPRMPEDGARLDQRQIDAVAKWIELGAAYDRSLRTIPEDDPLAWTRRTIDDEAREFWSFQPLQRPQVPAIEEDSWSRTDVDRFVLAKLQAADLSPNALASRRQLIRRAYFDLIGLPPSPAEVASFIEDPDPRAYEKLLDRLLASQHHGERVGRHWLDVARFAESHGFEQDYDRPHAYHYRDFVIKAFNADMPFDEFVRWQIAGDEIAPDNPLAMMATGFLGAGVFPTQLTEKEFESARYDELDDMVSTLGTAMLGVTIGCARCHDHKFDPIPARDYYQLVSAFRTTIRSNVGMELNPTATAGALERWTAELKSLESSLEQYEQQVLPARWEKFLSAADKREPEQSTPEPAVQDWIAMEPTSLRSEAGASFSPQDDGSYVVGGTNADFDTYTLVIETSLRDISSLRLEALADDSLPHGGPGRADNGNFGLSRVSLSVQPLDETQALKEIPLLDPEVTFQQNESNLSIASSLDDNPKSGWAVDPHFGENQAASFRLASPVGFSEGTRLVVRLEFQVNNRHNLGRWRLALAGDAERPALAAAAVPQFDAELQGVTLAAEAPLSQAYRSLLMRALKRSDPAWRAHQAAVQQHRAAQPQPQLTEVMICSENVPPIPNHGDGRGFPHFYNDSFFLLRGDINQKQGIATEGYLQVLTRAAATGLDSDPAARWKPAPSEAEAPESSTSFRRFGVAQWITDPEQGAGHLLARVIVNRLWQQHLGQGLVGTPNDFGFQGERPTHPELLDWLAGELIRNDWRLKPIRKLIMGSAVYMQDSSYGESGQRIDPNNTLLWRFAPRRLEAEIVRDAMLAVSGQLDATQFGPGTLDEAMRRRSIYFTIKRSRLIPFLQVFDTPEPLSSVGRRPTTTIAPQALIFMNNPQVREYASAFAQRTAGDDGEALEARILRAHVAAVARPPTSSELSGLLAFVEGQLAAYSQQPQADARQHAFTDLCQVLMSLSEFLYID